MHKLQSTLPIESNGRLIFGFSRPDLEVLVKEAKDLERIHNARKMRKRYFYIHDLDVVEALQRKNHFLLYDLDEYDKDNMFMTFNGKEFDDMNTLNGRAVLFKINDLDHTTSKRFAYAAHESVLKNHKIYSPQFKRKDITYSNKETAEMFFNYALVGYLRKLNIQ